MGFLQMFRAGRRVVSVTAWSFELAWRLNVVSELRALMPVLLGAGATQGEVTGIKDCAPIPHNGCRLNTRRRA